MGNDRYGPIAPEEQGRAPAATEADSSAKRLYRAHPTARDYIQQLTAEGSSMVEVVDDVQIRVTRSISSWDELSHLIETHSQATGSFAGFPTSRKAHS